VWPGGTADEGCLCIWERWEEAVKRRDEAQCRKLRSKEKWTNAMPIHRRCRLCLSILPVRVIRPSQGIGSRWSTTLCYDPSRCAFRQCYSSPSLSVARGGQLSLRPYEPDEEEPGIETNRTPKRRRSEHNTGRSRGRGRRTEDSDTSIASGA